MPTHTLYAYALSSEVPVPSELLLASAETFIAGRAWSCPDAWAVRQLSEDGTEELGLNLALPEPFQEPPGWFSDVEAIVAWCVQTRNELGCDFVIGVGDAHSGHSEDIIEVDSGSPKVTYLKQFLGVAAPTGRTQP